MRSFSKILILSLAVVAFSCKSNPRSEERNVSESAVENKEAEVVQETLSQEPIQSNVTQNDSN